MNAIVPCPHARKVAARSATTNYPPPRIVCLDCGQTLATFQEVREFIATLDPAERMDLLTNTAHSGAA